jgi:hypothetical protein
MAYIIENANLYQHGQVVETSIVVKNKQIYSIHTPVNQLKFLRMNMHNFVMAPTDVVMADNLPEQPNELFFIKNFIENGATTIIVPAPITYEFQLSPKLNDLRERLRQSPVDYLLAIKIPQNLLKPSVFAWCKKEKIPAVFVVIDDPEEFKTIAWSWIKQVSFPYNPVLIPIFNSSIDGEKALSLWRTVLSTEKLPHLIEYPKQGQALAKNELKKLGIYPQKGNLHSNGELSYNLFIYPDSTNYINGMTTLGYDKLVVTVQRGTVIRAGTTFDLSSARGLEVKVKVPGFFVSD